MIQSIERAIAILFAFSIERPSLSSAEVAQLVGLNRTTAHRILGTLEECGVIHREAARQKYGLSPRVLYLSNTFLQLSDIRNAGMAPLTELRDLTRETSALHIRDEYSRVIVSQVESHRELRRTYPNLGEPIPLHLGAPSKAILAFMSSDEIAEYLDQLTSFEPWAHRQSLEHELVGIVKKGYAISFQERAKGIVSIAAPIFDRSGVAVASVNVSGPVAHIGEAERDIFAAVVVRAARDISRALGYSNDVDQETGSSGSVERSEPAVHVKQVAD